MISDKKESKAECIKDSDVLILQEAAEQGKAQAQRDLGLYYEKAGDLQKAISLYTAAAKQEDAIAQYYLGICYWNSIGVKEDLETAFQWFKKAANQNHAAALCKLGRCYEQGLGTDLDMKLAAKFYKESAELGDATAQHKLGWCYMKGIAVDKDLTEGVKWYRKSADQGNFGALRDLGICYQHGEGIEADIREAARCYFEAMQGQDKIAKELLKNLLALNPQLKKQQENSINQEKVREVLGGYGFFNDGIKIINQYAEGYPYDYGETEIESTEAEKPSACCIIL